MTESPMPCPEIKGVTASPELSAAFADFMGAFEVFKETNDRRLEEIEKKSASDVVTGDKLTRIDDALDRATRRMDDLALKGARPHLGGDAGSAASIEHKAAFERYVRAGQEHGLKQLEMKALTGAANDAGFLAPEETEREVMRRLAAISPIRSIAGVRQVSSSVYKKPFSSAGPVVGWVGETAARPETAAPTLRELTFPTMELYAMPAATATLLDDAIVDMDQWLADEIETAFAEQEGAAFVAGDGNAKPRGFLDYPIVDETSWAWDNLGYVATGAAGAFASSSPADALIDLVYALKAGYRQNAHFVMNRKTQAAVRKFKDGEGNYLWQPPATPGAQASLLNFAVIEAEDMPDIAADETSVAFGDFRRGYLIVDRQGLRVLRDPYSAKPYVLFYTTKRVGGGVQDFDAIKLLKFAAS